MPCGWKICGVSDIAYLRTGATFDKANVLLSNKNEGIRVLRGGNISTYKIDFRADDIFIPTAIVNPSIYVQQYDIITPAVTSLENIGKMARVHTKPTSNYTVGGFVYLLSPLFYNDTFSKFLLYQFTSTWFIRQLQTIAKKSGAAFYNINKTKFNGLPVFIPPLEEQARIVNRIEELFTQIDIIEQNQAEIDTLYDEFRKRTLTLAIQGKLVPQDPNDEPASVLLEKIRAERKAKLGKKFVDSYIYKGDDNCYYEHIDRRAQDELVEVPFAIPESWAWSRISIISDSYIGLTYKPTDIIPDGGYIVLRSSNIKDGKINLDDIVRVSSNIPDKLKIRKNDIVICARNGSKKLVGKSAIVELDAPNLTFGAFMAICRTPLFAYVSKFLLTSCFFQQLASVSGTTTINQLTQASFNSFLIPIPPLAEQKHIVAKINEIFAML